MTAPLDLRIKWTPACCRETAHSHPLCHSSRQNRTAETGIRQYQLSSSSKPDGSILWACVKDRWLAWHIQSLPCVNPGAAQDVHVTPGYEPGKPTFSRSTTDWTQPGDTPKIEDDGGSSWKRLRSSPGLARDDNDDDDDILWTHILTSL